MADTSIDGARLSGVLRLTWMSDQLAHVVERSQANEPTGTWTNSRELHQPGEKPQVTRSALARNRFRRPLAQAC